jgi:hypothetical protein
MAYFNIILLRTAHERNCLFLSGFSTRSSYTVLISAMAIDVYDPSTLSSWFGNHNHIWWAAQIV